MAGDDSSGSTSLISLVPNISFDVICRFVPGLLIVALYAKGLNIEGLLNKIFFFTLAYLVGLTITAVSERVFKHLLYSWINIENGPKWLRHYDDGTIWRWIRSLRESDRSLPMKLLAEKTLFRNLCFFCLLAQFRIPSVLQNIPMQPRLLLAALTLIFLACLIICGKWLAFDKDSPPFNGRN